VITIYLKLSSIAFSFICLLFLWARLCHPAASTQDFEDPEFLINYAYATWIGTGIYTVGDRQVYTLRVPYSSHTLKESKGKRTGYRLLFPLTLGFEQFEEIPENLATFAFVPGLEVNFPVTTNWQLKPFIQGGYGNDYHGGQGAWIYGGGIRSVAQFQVNKWRYDLGNTLMSASQQYADDTYDNGFSMFEIGLNLVNPWRFTFMDQRSRIDTFFIYTNFIDDVDILFADRSRDEVNELYQLGVALVPDDRFQIGFIKFKGLGISLMAGDGIQAIRFHTGFPF
jgi:hypothetical protein